MPHLRKPSAQAVRRFLDAQADLDFTYPQVGATAGVPPPGYAVDHTRVRLGDGEGVFRAARAVLEKARDAAPDELELWGALVDLARRQKDTEQARKVIAAARARLGDTAVTRLAEARYLAAKNGKGAKGGDVMTRTHATGAALSYGMRYLLRMIFNVAVGEGDTDGNGATARESKGPEKPNGFDAWFKNLEAFAEEGTPKLQKVWRDSAETLRNYLTKTDSAAWERLKQIAARVVERQREAR